MEDSCNHLVDKATNENTVMIIVCRIMDYRFFVTPNGNYSSSQFGDFSTSKFLFVVCIADGTPFAQDYIKFLDNLGKIQNEIACTPNHLNFLGTMGRTKTMRFTCNVFEERVCVYLR